ncbi:hypothetical protein [Methanocella sp.]|uniref:hypothetical protein n=1 Tax=Methanocella sp. TaxID=2052833 RepID=UPI002D7FF1AB|nr:hypothetical protein [Methanocella sp.]
MALLLISTFTASASIAGLSFPAIKPSNNSSSSDASKILDSIGDFVKFTNYGVSSRDNNLTSIGFPAELSMSSLPNPQMLISVMAPQGKSSTASLANINKTLIGTNLTYTSIAGKPMNYTITADSIKSVQPFAYNGERAWKVRVGEGMAWDLIMDSTGTKILKTDQLFQT